MITDPGPITAGQRELYDAIEENGTEGTALVSVIETATGQQRAVICTASFDSDGGCIMRPIALLLEHEDDMDRFTPPGGIT